MSVPINLDWPQFKTFVAQFSLLIDYAPEGIHYFLFSSNGSVMLSAYLTDPTEVLEFETFYKPDAFEVSIPPGDGGPGTLVVQGTTPWDCAITGSISLPVGASTAAKQDTGNASLSSINGKILTPGQAPMSTSSPVVIASDQSSIPVTATQGGVWSVAATQSGVWFVSVAGTISAAQSGVWAVSISGTAAVTQSGVWTVAATQSGVWTVAISGTVPISAAALPLPTGAATETTLSSINGKTPSLGQVAMTASVPVAIASDQSPFSVSVGTSAGKTIIGKTGTLVTTATTADQVILTYTVTGGKTFYLEGFDWAVGATALAHADTDFGNISLETPSGTKIQTWFARGAGRDSFVRSVPEPLPIASGTVIRLVVTPSSTTSFTWVGNLIGYEK